MSLVDQSLPTREVALSSQSEGIEEKPEQQKSSYRDSLPGAPQPICSTETYDDTIFDEFYEGMMDGAPQKAQAVEQPPALPEKSARRASRTLDGLAMALGTPQPAKLPESTPYDTYLSSEEDPSSSADDFSDYDFESDSDISPKSPTRRRSHEDTARIVSVIFVGKPSLVDLSTIRRSISPSSIQSREQGSRGSSSVETSPSSSSRRTSTSSASTLSISQRPRTNSIFIEQLAKEDPPFLTIDPFAKQSHGDNGEERGEQDTPKTPKTPTAMFMRTFSLVRKRSRPILNNLNSSAHTLPIEEQPKQEVKGPEPEAQSQPTQQDPVTYQDIMRAAKKNAKGGPMSPIPQSPQSPASPGRRVFGGFSRNRRRSIKAS